MNVDIEQIKKIIISASKDILLPSFNEVSKRYKADGSIVTEADLAMQQALIDTLRQRYPSIGFLGEEMTPEQQQGLLDSEQPLWCVDPIDGTSNYSAGLPYFCVSLALIVNKSIVLGIIYDPIRDECFSARQGCGAYLNDQLLTAQSTHLNLEQSIALIDFKRLPNDMAAKLVTDKPYSSQRSLGSIALELCWLAAGRSHVYLHAKQQLWDYAAAYVILNEVNAHASTLSGQDIFDGSLQSKSTVAASNKALYTQWINYLNTIM